MGLETKDCEIATTSDCPTSLGYPPGSCVKEDKGNVGDIDEHGLCVDPPFLHPYLGCFIKMSEYRSLIPS